MIVIESFYVPPLSPSRQCATMDSALLSLAQSPPRGGEAAVGVGVTSVGDLPTSDPGTQVSYQSCDSHVTPIHIVHSLTSKQIYVIFHIARNHIQ